MSILEGVNSPKDIKNLNIKELETLCSEIREYMISCCSLNPGHLGASLGAIELAVALHYVFDTPNDKLIWDVGHQAYAHKIITGRREEFKNNRMFNGLSGFPKIAESPYDAFGAGHASTSISAALGIAVASEKQGIKRKVIAIIGDGALTGGLAFEGLNNAGALKTDLLVIVNDNKISIDKSNSAIQNHLLKISTSHSYNRIKNKVWNVIGARKLRGWIQKFTFSTKFAFFKSGSLFQSLGFRYFGTIDGNNIGELITFLRSLDNIRGPKVLHISTKKGKGYRPAEEDQVVWHAPGTFDPKTGKRTVSMNGDLARYQDVFAETLLELARGDSKIVGITPAMATGCGMDLLMREMPERVFDVGIAEQHAVTFSAGLAAEGLLPYCNIYSSFMQRAYDSVIHDVAVQNLKMVLCIDRGGIVGEDGATHHGVFDLAYFRAIPNLIIAAPYDELELRNLLYSASLPSYPITVIRYPRGYGAGVKWRSVPFTEVTIGKAQLLNEGSGVALLSLGPVGHKATKAIKRAEGDGMKVLHYDMRFLKPIDTEALTDAAKKASVIITVEDGTVVGGLYSAVSEFIANNGLKCKVVGLGVPDKFIEQGTLEELYSYCGFNTDDIYAKIKESYEHYSL